jgi:uncharacterized protein YceK
VKPFLIALAILLISGCASYQATLRNKNGETITCEASGKSGLITGYYLKEGFDTCVDNAHKSGFN